MATVVVLAALGTCTGLYLWVRDDGRRPWRPGTVEAPPAPAASWRTVTLPGGTASVEMPGEPVDDTAERGTPGLVVSLRYNAPDDSVAYVLFDTIPPARPTTTGTQVLDDAMRDVRQGFERQGSAVVREGPIWVGHVPGTEMEAHPFGEQVAVFRSVVVRRDDQWHRLSARVNSRKGRLSPADRDRFLNSFKVLRWW